MSRQFWMAVALIMLAFAAFETAINLQLRALHDEALEQCVRPAEVPLTRLPGVSA